MTRKLSRKYFLQMKTKNSVAVSKTHLLFYHSPLFHWSILIHINFWKSVGFLLCFLSNVLKISGAKYSNVFSFQSGSVLIKSIIPIMNQTFWHDSWILHNSTDNISSLLHFYFATKMITAKTTLIL